MITMVNPTKYKPKFVFHFEYAGYHINIYPKKIKAKAIEFLLFDAKNNLTKESLWIPKRTFEKREGNELLDTDWLFDEYKNREKLERIGYRL